MKKRRIIFFGILIIIVVLIILAIVNKKPDVEYTTVEAVVGDLTQTVIETGTVKPIQEIKLNFQSSGKLGEVLTSVGATVEQDQVLARLDQVDLLIRQREAQANLKIAQANLDKLIAGASNSEIAVAQANEAQAEATYQAALKDLDKAKSTATEKLAQAQKNYTDLTSSAPGTDTTQETTYYNTKKTYQKSVDNYTDILLTTIENKQAVATTALDAINRLLTDDDIEDYLGVRDVSSVINTKSTHKEAINLLTLAKADLTASKGVATAYNSTMSAINKTFTSLNYCFSMLENSAISTDLTLSELDTFKSGINTQITTVATAITNLQSAKQNLDDALLTYDTKVADALASLQSAILTAEQTLSTTKVTNAQTMASAESKVETSLKAWQIYQAQLAQLTATARLEDLTLKRAQVSQAQAQLDLINSEIEQNTIKAPIAGVVTKIDFEVGEQTTPGTSVITMLADHDFNLELDISETDISKIQLGNLATLTIDAYGDDIKFPGEVVFIEPAETEIQGVIYYKVKIDFEPGDYEIKSGMTASADIITAQKPGVLMIPVRAVLDNNGKKTVRILFGKNSAREMPVETGLLGDDGLVEVLSGVQVGDQVVTYVKDVSKK